MTGPCRHSRREAGISEITQTDAGYKRREVLCRETVWGSERSRGLGRPDLELGGGGRVAEEVTFHLTPEGWAGVSLWMGEGPGHSRPRDHVCKRPEVGKGSAASEELRRVHVTCI